MDRSKPQEIGTLVIVVLKARNLHDLYFWKQDVLAQIGLNGETQRTKVDIKGGQHPMWDEEIRVPVMKNANEKYRKLEVSCWSKSPSKEDNIGQGSVDLADTLKTGEFDDWVPLQINGAARGEVYLEMTFFSHAPAPSGLMVPKTNLQRRPSKLSPAERLARPQGSHRPQEHLPPVQEHLPPVQKPAASEHLATPGPTRTSPSRAGRESPLPPIPDQAAAPVPNALMPGRPNHQGNQLKPQGGPTHVPSILRPRNPKSSPIPIHGPPVEYNGVVPPQGQTYAPESPPRTYTPVVPPPVSQYEDASAAGYVSPPPPQWGAANDTPGGFFFPVPTLPGAREPTAEYPPPSHAPGHERHGSSGGSTSFSPPPQAPYQPSHSPFQQPPYPSQPPFAQQPQFQAYQPPASPYQAPPPINTYHRSPPPARNGNELPDPYLLARYQTPLPLPPDSPTRSGREVSHSQLDHANPDNARLQAVRQAEEEAAKRREREREQKEREQRQREQRQREEAERRKREEEAERRRRTEEEEAARRKAEEKKRAEEEAARRNAAEKKRAEDELARRREQERKERERVLRQAEEEAARRREQERKDRELAQQVADEASLQEERDRELARQLDRELNLGEENNLPGRW